MPRGGYRPGSGPMKGAKYRPRGSKVTVKKKADLPDDIIKNAAVEKLTPLEYMLKVMNDPNEDKDMRARMAQAAAPYIHPKAGESKGKKDEKADRAKRAGGGKFAAGAPPLRVVK